jgi:hypothetical protein
MRRRLMIIAGIVLVALALTGGAIAVDSQTNDEDSATGPDADRAAAAALAHLGSGTVSEIERDPEGARVWKVEVVNDAGNVVDVELDGNYQVVHNPDDDSDDAPEPAETPAQDAADDAADANEPDDDADDVGDTEREDDPDDIGDTD